MNIALVPDVPENSEEVYQDMFPYFIEQLAREMLESGKDINDILSNKKEFDEMILITFFLEYFLFFPKGIGGHMGEIQEKTHKVLHRNRTRRNSEDPRNHKHYQGFWNYVHSDLERVKESLRQKFTDTDWQDLSTSLI